MPDWTKSMKQTYEYYIVDPISWNDKTPIRNVKSCSVNWDLSAQTLGSASIDTTEDIGECYIRPYLVTIQNGTTEKFCLGTFLVQTPSATFDGKSSSVTLDAYTPLLELKDTQPPLGYTILKGENVMDNVHKLVSEYARAPVTENKNDALLIQDFVADVDDSWLTYLTDLMTYAKLSFSLDERCRILFAPTTQVEKMQPVWTYADDNCSILLPEITVDRDLYGIPNVVQVIYSTSNGTPIYCEIVNNDPNSPTSTVNRGRRVTHRDSNPSFKGEPNEMMVQEYATNLLESLSTLEYTLSYTHGYNQVRIGDCVRFNYKRAGLMDIKAKVTTQKIKCESGCLVEETAAFTTKLWEGK